MKKNNKTKNANYCSQTRIEHEDYDPNLSVGAVWPPIYTTTTYRFKSAKEAAKAFQEALSGKSLSNLIYSRVNHPLAEILEKRLVYIEEPFGCEAAVFGSGLAAIKTAILAAFPKNKKGQVLEDKVIAYTNPLYGGTYHFLVGYLKNCLGFKIMELSPQTKVACRQLKKIGRQLGILYMETPANPTLQMHDIAKLTVAAKAASAKCATILDNTFMGIFQKGFNISEHLDLIVYSGTKFIGGHSDVLNGAVICRSSSQHFMKDIKGLRIIFGNILHPFECSQVLVHLQTYKLRMEKLSANAAIIASYSQKLRSPKIEKILHPTLFQIDTPEYNIYQKQCTGGSSLICFWLKTNKAGAFRFLDKLNDSGIVQLAVSLGGLESLASHPASTTHSEMSKDVLTKLNISDNLIRFSVGDEDPYDLIKVISEALTVV